MFGITVCTTRNIERKKRDLSGEIRKKTTPKNGQCNAYKTMSMQKELLILLRSFRFMGLLPPGYGHKKKNYSRLNRKIVPVVSFTTGTS